MRGTKLSLTVITVAVLGACGGGNENSAVGSEPTPTPTPAPSPAPTPTPTPAPAPAPAPTPAAPTARISPLGTLNQRQTQGYEFKGGMSADADHIYASLYETSSGRRLQQWIQPVFEQADRTRWALVSENQLAMGRYRFEVVSGRGSVLSTLQAIEFDVVNDLAAPMSLAVEGGGVKIRLIDAYDGVTISGATEPDAQVGVEFWQRGMSTNTLIDNADSNGDFRIVYPRAALPPDGDYMMHVMRTLPASTTDYAQLPISIMVDPVRTVMSCETGSQGGRYNFSKPSFREEPQWVDIDTNGDVLRNGETSGELNNLSAVGTVTDLGDGYFSWRHSVPALPGSGTAYTIVYALDGAVRSSGSSGYAPVGLVVTQYEICVPAGDDTGTIPAAPTIDIIAEDDVIDVYERFHLITVTGSGIPMSVVKLRTSFGYEESARVNADGTWLMRIFNLSGQTLDGVSGSHSFTAFVRFNEQNSTITSRPVFIALNRELARKN